MTFEIVAFLGGIAILGRAWAFVGKPAVKAIQWISRLPQRIDKLERSTEEMKKADDERERRAAEEQRLRLLETEKRLEDARNQLGRSERENLLLKMMALSGAHPRPQLWNETPGAWEPERDSMRRISTDG